MTVERNGQQQQITRQSRPGRQQMQAPPAAAPSRPDGVEDATEDRTEQESDGVTIGRETCITP